ncbi:hypothetical protein RIF29_15473 [Crotalaria pallida]|uniref:ARID domain-containing protein n=1 Tax=Crotalaria pallida TaxID=3830 RepID=A0AAN9IB76_CROPI
MAANGDNRDGVLVEIGVGPAAIRRRFEALLSKQWIEIPDFSRPIPPVLGDGTEVDLFKLTLVLISNGGFDFVCESKLWDSVAEESGLGSSAGSAVKVVYCRYLSEFVDDDDMFGMFGKRLTDLERLLVDYVSDEFHPDMKIAGIEFRWKSVDDDDDDDDDDYAGLLLYADGDSGSRKRKRESLSGMLSWLAKLAKNPLDPTVGSLPKKSKWKSFSDREVWKLGLLLRKALFFRMRFGSRTARMKWQVTKTKLNDDIK